MPYADELVRVTVTYKPTGEARWAGEEAQYGFWLRHHHITGNGFTWADQMPHLVTDLQAKYVAHWGGGLSSFHPSGVQISQFKAAHIDSAGHDLDVAAVDLADGTLPGTSTGKMMPPEVAIVVSLFSYVPGGFAVHKGRKRSRLYLPYVSASLLETDGTMNDDFDVADDYAVLFNDIQGMHTFNEDTPPDPTPDYWDLVSCSKIDATWHNIDRLSVDNHFDSQRRRQHQAPPTRHVDVISHA